MLSLFFTTFNSHHQVFSLYGQRFYQLVCLYSDLVISYEEPILGIKPLQNAILALEHNQETNMYSHQVCGSLHREFTKLCIKAKCYQHALKIIEFPVVGFRKHTQAIDVVSYLYYKGLVYIGLKRNEEAFEQF